MVQPSGNPKKFFFSWKDESRCEAGWSIAIDGEIVASPFLIGERTCFSHIKYTSDFTIDDVVPPMDLGKSYKMCVFGYNSGEPPPVPRVPHNNMPRRPKRPHARCSRPRAGSARARH